MTRNVYTQEQSTLDAMVVVSGIGHDTKASTVFEMTHKLADVMRSHCDWTITPLQADNVAKEVTHRFGI